MDIGWLDECQRNKAVMTGSTALIDGVKLELPVALAGGSRRDLDWQRRVSPDILPDSANDDAAERTPFRILFALTSNMATPRRMREVLEGELAPLAPLFQAETRSGQKKRMTLGFHALAVRGAEVGEAQVKGFTERTFLLLCRDPKTGRVDNDLVRSVIEQFRAAPKRLDLAQRTVLDRLSPGWTPDEEPRFVDVSKDVLIPFDSAACLLFQEDLRALVGASLEPADFFHHFDLLLRIHFGLYLPRVAVTLNPQVDCLLDELSGGDGLRNLDALLLDHERCHPFRGCIATRGPDPTQERPVSQQTAARLSVEKVERELVRLHFNLLVFMQVRRLAKAYLTHHWGAGDIDGATRTVRQIIERLRDDDAFRRFIDRGLTLLCARYIGQQLTDDSRDAATKACGSAKSSLHALRDLYVRQSQESTPQPTRSRANRQGITVVLGMLRHEDLGLMRSRARVGPFFEVGSSLLPLLLLLTLGQGREKAPVGQFWQRLEAYGLALDADERRHVESQLRSMGVYERYSDSGDAVYVRNLLQPRLQP